MSGRVDGDRRAAQPSTVTASRSGSNGTGGIQVIARAGQILRTLGSERQGLSLTDLAQQVNLPRSTVHRIVSALESEGLTASASPNGRYKLGPELYWLAAGQHDEFPLEAKALLRALSAEINETVDLSVLIGDQVSFVDQVAAPHRLRAVSAVGACFSAYCTANGKALLACYDEEFLRKLLPSKLAPATPNTTTDRELLLEELDGVRRQGYAFDREEHTLGICAVGAVVDDGHGPVAAISLPVPTPRFVGNERSLIDALLCSTAEISRRLRAQRS